MIAFVSNGSFIDGNAADGIRKSFAHEFSRIFIYNLRGNQRTSGEQSRKEGGKVFGSGSRTQVAIAVLIKNFNHVGPAEIQYRDIGDYLTREEKLDILRNELSLEGTDWEIVTANEHGDWINHRDEKYDTYQPIGDKATKGKTITPGIFENYSRGLETGRDSWVYSFLHDRVVANTNRMIDEYNENVHNEEQNLDPTKISWTSSLSSLWGRGQQLIFDENMVRSSMYRPFCKQHVYFGGHMNHRLNQLPKIFPTPEHPNLAITLPGPGSAGGFYALMQDRIPALGVATSLQCFSLYSYEKVEAESDDLLSLIGTSNELGGYRRRDNITDATLKAYQEIYGDGQISKEEIFYYVYGLLHGSEYKEKYAADLSKMLPRIPKVRDFWGFSSTGRKLAQLHLTYESVEPYPLGEVVKNTVADEYEMYRVQKMAFIGRKDKTGIVYNSNITLTDIPEEVLEYRLMGNRSALEWIIDRYQVTTHKASQIRNDPNDFSREIGNPRYIIDLIKRIVTVSVETNRIVKSLPALETIE